MNVRHLLLALLIASWPLTACGGSDEGAGTAGSDTSSQGGDDTSSSSSDSTTPEDDTQVTTDPDAGADDTQGTEDPDTTTVDDAGPDVPVEPPPEPIALDSAQVHPSVQANLTDAGERVQEAFEWLKASETLGCILGDDDEEEEEEPGDGDTEEEEEPFSMLELFTDIADFLTDDILTTVETADGVTVLYTIDLITLFCEDEEDGVTSIDEECAESFEDVVAQVSIVSYAEGELDMAILINGGAPVTISLHGDDHAVHIDLAQVLTSWDAIKDGFVDDEDGSFPFEFDTMSGLVAVTVDVTDGAPILVNVAATTDIAVVGKIDGDPVQVDLPPSELSVHLDEASNLIDIGGALAHLQAGVAGELITKIIGDGCDDDDDDEPLPPGEEPEPCVPNELTGAFAIDLAGLSAAAQLDDAQAHIAVTDLTMGGTSTTVTREGQTILNVDMNAALDWTVSLTLSLCGDAPQLAVDPALEVSAMFAMAPLSDTFPDLDGHWMEDDTLDISLTGDAPMVSFDPLQVVSGTLAMSSTSRPDLDQSITTGQCFQLTEDDEGSELPDELLSVPCGEPSAFDTVYTGENPDAPETSMRWTFPHFDAAEGLTPPPGEPGNRFHVLEEGWMYGAGQWCASECASWTDWTCAGFMYKYWGNANEGGPEKEWKDGNCILLEKLEAKSTTVSNLLSAKMSDPGTCPVELAEHIFDEMAVTECKDDE